MVFTPPILILIVNKTGALYFGLRFLDAGFISGDFCGPLLGIFFGTGAALRKPPQELLLILRVFELALEFDDLLRRYLDIGFQYQDALLASGELGLELVSPCIRKHCGRTGTAASFS